MKIEDYDTEEKCLLGIERRQKEEDHLRPFIGGHFDSLHRFRAIHRNRERLMARLDLLRAARYLEEKDA